MSRHRASGSIIFAHWTQRHQLSTQLIYRALAHRYLYPQVVTLTAHAIIFTLRRVTFFRTACISFVAPSQQRTQSRDIVHLHARTSKRVIITRIHGLLAEVSSYRDSTGLSWTNSNRNAVEEFLLVRPLLCMCKEKARGPM